MHNSTARAMLFCTRQSVLRSRISCYGIYMTQSVPSTPSIHQAWQRSTKVPQIAGIFWVVKLLTTAMGEATADYLVARINPYIAVALGGVLLAVALLLQFRAPRYRPITYWFTVAMVAVFGTMAADALHVQFGVPYIGSTTGFAIILAVAFFTWQKTEGTLSIHSIHTFRREIFYWITVMATFALGTAAGDMTASTLGLGYFTSILLFTGLIALPALAYWLFNANAVVTFWCAYVLTRPIGASIADWLGKPKWAGGRGFGDGIVALVLAILITILVSYLAITHADSQSHN